MKAKNIKSFKGYMTLEAVFVFVTSLSVMLFSISAGIFYYERCVMELDTYYELQRSMEIGEKTQEYIVLEGGYGSAVREKEFLVHLGLAQEEKVSIHVDARIKGRSPKDALRLCRRIKGIENERDTQNESTVLEDSQ
ncbi:MAG: hypothetical protein IJY10_04555 [Lachnospiraceae bacterium]|nr:hypothetical protein [Lachnospiraceae bacterium]